MKELTTKKMEKLFGTQYVLNGQKYWWSMVNSKMNMVEVSGFIKLN
jgi:alkylation response protein AidB-like acyl-CoA dehydrogenase